MRYFGLGRAAMTEAFRAAGLEGGSRVLFPAFICADATHAATALGCSVGYYGVAPDLAPAEDEKEWPEAAAVVAVDYFGFAQDLTPFRRYVSRTRALLVEDNAHGLFSRAPDGAWLGLRGDAGVFSLRKTIALPYGAALAIPPGSRVPAPPQGAFQHGAPLRHRAKQALRALGCATGGGALRALHKLARGGGGGGGGGLEESLMPPSALAAPLTLGDPELEVERRRALYAWCDRQARPLGARPVFASLPSNASPFTYAYRADGSAAARIEEHFDRAGLDVFCWPELPREVETNAPAHYRDVRCVRFLW